MNTQGETKGDRIHIARKNANLTMDELGKSVGVSKATIKRYESGEISNIPSDKIELIAQATGVTESYIMGWDTLKKENASFHSKILKDKITLDMISMYYELNKSDQKIIREMISRLANKKDW